MSAKVFAAPDIFSPDWSNPPGFILQAELDARGITQSELASRAGLSTKHVNQVIKGVAPLTPETALRLERCLGIPSTLWNSLEATYQGVEAQDRATAKFSHYSSWLRRFPISELVRRGILASDDDDATRVERLLRFFGVADPDAYDAVWLGPLVSGFRRAQHLKVNPDATAVWLRLGEIKAGAVSLKRFNAQGLRRLLPELRKLTTLPDSEGFRELQRRCAEVGVAVVFVPEVKGSRACGAARWMGAHKAVIILSGRYTYADSLWFSFFHEAAHLILHPKRRTIVHLEHQGDNDDGHETEADSFAVSALVPQKYQLALSGPIAAEEVATWADRAQVDAGIIAGQLGYRFDAWRTYAKLRHKLVLDADITAERAF